MEEFPEPLRIVHLVLYGICLFLAGLAIVVVLFSNSQFIVPHVAIDPGTLPAPPVDATRTFRYHNTSATVPLAVNGTVYAASKRTFRSIFMVGNVADLEQRYYGAMIGDPTQDAIYRDLLVQFRAIRAERNLSDDEYLEMMTAYVQTIPYRDGGAQPPKYPAELLAENMGDCDDKAILLAGLLAREDYTVVLFKFGPESHMAMGIGSDTFPYRSTGYLYIEPMTPAYAGIPSFTLMTRKPLNSDPIVIPVSTGPVLYRSANQTSSIRNATLLAQRRAAELSARLDLFPAEQKNSTEYRTVLAERDRYDEVFRYIMSHPLDRPGTCAYLQQVMPV